MTGVVKGAVYDMARDDENTCWARHKESLLGSQCVTMWLQLPEELRQQTGTSTLTKCA